MTGIPADILLYALIAAGLVFWLRNILGTRHGDERQRPNPFTSVPSDEKMKKTALKDKKEGKPPMLSVVTEEDGPSLPRGVRFADADVEEALDNIARMDKGFDLVRFSSAAKEAFVIIVEAFAQGDRETLKNLLTEQVYAAFDGALKIREEKGESVLTEIHAVREVEFRSAVLEKTVATVTVAFTADETCVIRGRDGEILSGDPERITQMIDVWRFTRDLKSKDPRWLVSETNDGEIEEEHKTPLPESS